ncbi:MAG TPA: circadian clock KaiB family protein [Anaerolineales bacterium]|nr:circadian clock protein KaiB [Anaerolineae bacterium]HRJ59405.1 circadian clock KaiB family protein [Anaerolineales bacterium]HRK90195.1 circadian clock KaiB family protein [Anaerolineales bacterium]
MTHYVFKLFITGRSPHADTALANLKHVCDTLLDDECSITVVDVDKDPEQAEIDQILATPTLVKEYPLPQRRIIGDLSDIEKVKKALGLGY